MKEKFFTNPHTVTLTVEQEDYDKIKAEARRADLLTGPFIRKIIKEYLSAVDDNQTNGIE